jgi:hypothetical protein
MVEPIKLRVTDSDRVIEPVEITEPPPPAPLDHQPFLSVLDGRLKS